MRIGIIGGGFMGEAFMHGLIAGVVDPSDVTVAEVFDEKRAALAQHGVLVTAEAREAVEGADVVLMAVKPQDFATAAAELKGAIDADAIVISIAAGIALADIQALLGHDASARVMPNLPAAVGQAAAAYLVAPAVTPEQVRQLRIVVDAVAIAVSEVHDDEAIDLATAVHGSGPAYVYAVMEAMIDAAVRLGQTRSDATDIVLATFAGSARYAIETGTDPAELRAAVTSRGGTTAAALAKLEAAGLAATFDEAIEAAFIRAKELGEG
ncbi:MAG: pyrroline-5-carboxylate reductase [Dehalococcoidia bacterium]|jgi:pyrroline-5-carboxylate reductase|nr:pyrroline-5-carboxylate reductase [Dehalococcoidia bacterium]